MPDLLRRFIALVSRLAPRSARREFRDEWNGELAADPSLVRALGAIPDAWFLFRQQWSLDMLLQDVRYALRILRQRPGYTLVVILTLAIGIGANTAMFSAIDGVLFQPLPLRDPSRIVRIWENDRLNRKPRYQVAPANFDDWRTQTKTFEGIAAYSTQSASAQIPGSPGVPFHARVALVTPNFFDVMGAGPLLGRAFTPADGVAPHHRVMILSHAAWMTHFGGDPAIVGRTISYAENPYVIVGIMPETFVFPNRGIDAWRPMVFAPQTLAARAQHFLDVVGRMRPGVTLGQAQADLESVAAAAQRKYPATNDQRGTTAVPLRDAIVGDIRTPMYLLGAAVALLLLIACANVANLMLVQGTARRREMAVRSALGADRFRIARQLLVEGAILAAAGGTAGVALAAWGTRGIARAAVNYVPRAGNIQIDLPVLAFAIALSLATGLFFAFAPALRASRTDVQRDLRESGRGTVGGGRWLRNVLVVVEFAAAVVLVVGAALLLESFWRVVRVQPGFATASVMSIETELPNRYGGNDAAPIVRFYTDLVARLSAVPSVQGAAIVNNVPMSGNAWTSWLTIENKPTPPGEPPEVGYRVVTPGYFATMQIPVLKGRSLADTDTAAAMKVVVVNQALADRFFGAGDAVGSHVRLGPNPKAPWRTIVGIVGNVHHEGLEVEPAPESFEPLAQDTNADLTLVVRGAGDRAAMTAAVRDVAHAVDPDVVLWRMQWLDGVIDEHLAPRRLAMQLVEGFAGVALALALLGIYGVMSYTVTERVPEIGVRMALGAAPSEIHGMVIRDGLRLAIPGLLLGGVAALVVSRIARAMLFEVSPADPLAFGTVTVGVLVVALIACYAPARRAARIDPLSAIRAE